MARYIFVTGGVVSSLGKGLSSASLAYLLKSQGFKTLSKKYPKKQKIILKEVQKYFNILLTLIRQNMKL